MNKIPVKQIYMLSIIIIGIIALSVYSTYALFTFESSTANVVSIHTPKSLSISENIYEYQQIIVEPNSVTTTDIDIYNSYEYDVCYSIWYKIIGEDSIEDRIQIFEKSDETITASGTLTALNNIRVTVVIVNDNDSQVKVNLGTAGSKNENGSCSLNLASDKKVISSSYSNLEVLREKLFQNKDQIKQENASYLVYKNETKKITYDNNDKIYIAETFNYNDETFTLINPEELTIQALIEKKYLETKNVYFCKENDKCSILYKITQIEKREETINNELNVYYDIKLYDKLIGYLGGSNGLKKINEQDYVFYGDNPNNFIYYNCENNDDTSTCELWRIIGLYYNQDTKNYNIKIIRNDSIGKFQYDNTNSETLTWKNSSLNKYLNEDYKFINNSDIYIEDNKQNEEIVTLEDNIIKKLSDTTNLKVNLINLSEYLYASSCNISKLSEITDECNKNNWLNNIEIEKNWTSTLKEKKEVEIEENNENLTQDETENQEEIVEEEIIIENYGYAIGNKITENNINSLQDVRPVVYLKSRMLVLDGDGSLEKPYVIK